MKFYSDAKQDEFVANILEHKKDGFYVDIGSNGSQASNNSFHFDNFLNWRGLCVEIDQVYSESYKNRKNCTLIIEDALKVDYSNILQDIASPKIIDYLSIDIDTLSLQCLNIIPFNNYKFKVITIEHDGYLYGDTYRLPQREKLLGLGYELVCRDVFVEQSGYEGKMFPFEDWYVYPDFFDKNKISKIESNMNYPSEIINKF